MSRGLSGVALILLLSGGASACATDKPVLPYAFTIVDAESGTPKASEPGVRYVASPRLHDFSGIGEHKSWPARGMSSRASVATVARLARAFDVRGVVRTTPREWRIADGARELVVDRRDGLAFELVNHERGLPARDPDLLTASAAKRVAARALVVGASADIRGVEPRAWGGFASWTVEFDGVHDGGRIDGFTHSVTVGGRGDIVAARGFLGRPYKLGNYPLAHLTRVIDRLNDDVKPRTPTREVVVSQGRMRNVLVKRVDGGLAVLPMFAFRTDDSWFEVVAVADEYLDTSQGAARPLLEANPSVSTSPGTCVAAVPSVSKFPQNQPLTGQVCVDHVSVRVGEDVTFTVSGTDPDMDFKGPRISCDGPFSVDFGDEEPNSERPCLAVGAGRSGRNEFSETTVYRYLSAGVFEAKFRLSSGYGFPPPPGWSVADAVVTIEVSN